MEHFWTLYWITRLDSLGTLFLILASVSTFATAICVMSYINSGEGFYKKADEQARKTCKRYGMFFAFLVLTFSTAKALMPSKEDAYFIAAGVGITEAVKSETAQRLASKSVGVIEQWLDKQSKTDDNEQVKQEEKK